MDGFFVAAQILEMKAFLNTRVGRPRQIGAFDFVLPFQDDKDKGLTFSVHPRFFRFHFGVLPDSYGEAETSFEAVAQKALSGARLVGVEQSSFERMVVFKWENYTRIQGLVAYHLIWEGMGKRSNLILINPSTGGILEVIKKIPASINRVRVLLPGEIYQPPPAQEKINPCALNPEAWEFLMDQTDEIITPGRWLAARLFGISPVLAEEIAFRANLPPETNPSRLSSRDRNGWREALELFMTRAKAGPVEPLLYQKGRRAEFYYAPLLHLEAQDFTKTALPSLHALLDTAMGQKTLLQQIQDEKQSLRQSLQVHLRRAAKKLSLQKDELAGAENMETHKLKADLIFANLPLLKKGMDLAILPSFTGEEEVEVALDPALTPVENARRYLKKYQKAKNALVVLTGHLEKTRGDLYYLQSLELALEEARGLQTLQELKDEFEAQGLCGARRRKKIKKAAPASEPHRFICPDGSEILVGKNNLQNERITFQLAKPDDLWFHVKDYPGSHCILRPAPVSAPVENLLAAANLAVFFSKARDSSKVAVDYTMRKYVKKPPKAKPGMVIYHSFQTIIVDPDPQILGRFIPVL
ncbi:MAG: NFACT family protein [Bacillota bacterium]